MRSTAVRKLCELSDDFRTEHTDLWGRYRVGRSGSGVREICQPLLFLNKREAQDVTLVAPKRVGRFGCCSCALEPMRQRLDATSKIMTQPPAPGPGPTPGVARPQPRS